MSAPSSSSTARRSSLRIRGLLCVLLGGDLRGAGVFRRDVLLRGIRARLRLVEPQRFQLAHETVRVLAAVVDERQGAVTATVHEAALGGEAEHGGVERVEDDERPRRGVEQRAAGGADLLCAAEITEHVVAPAPCGLLDD